MKIRVADYIAQTLARQGIEHVFMVTGGGAMHLNDAFGRVKKLQYICCHHEQACTMAAESYFRMSSRLAAVNVTTGPGGTNAITGVYGAYVDSLGMVVISGQVKWETLVRSTDLPLRQLGDQEVDIIQMVASITKYSEIISDPSSIRYHLEKALYLATAGRPGPVWLDIPMNVQATLIEPEKCKGFDPLSEKSSETSTPLVQAALKSVCNKVLERLKQAKRPVILVGSGVRLAKAHQEFLQFVDTLGIPVTTAWNAHDVLWNDHPCYVGRPGTIGDRAGNFAVQNSDFLLVLGSRLNIRQISYGWENFAREAFKVHVDIDPAELHKPTLKTDLPIHADLKDFLQMIISLNSSGTNSSHKDYLKWCLIRKDKYPVVLPEYWKIQNRVNPYCFVESLFKQLEENELIVTGDGTACVTTFQAANIKIGQRLYTNSGCASMGYDLPAAIGACFALRPKRLICIAGDGSIMLNLQELQTIVTHRLPIKIFVLNNKGYHSIRQTQQNYFPDNVVGCGLESGLAFPDFEKIANAFEIPFRR
ncbi:MAG: thiamine pyrophosphate-binding protein, partial [Bdellovibrionia bacterium]